MRIACIHVPQFALQSATRLDPSLRGAPVVVVGGAEAGTGRPGVLHAPVVLACSRAAWALGVRLGMTAVAARGLSPELSIVTADAAVERETMRAIGDALLELTSGVELGSRVGAGGAHLAMYAEVPAKTRGSTFGDRLLDRLDALGLTGRVGIADDRFTAWVAAAYGAAERASAADRAEDGGVVTVPRGGSAAFLAPRPLSLLAISPEVQHMLEALGVRTLGEFATLPAPSVARPLEADYQALARGESGAALRPYAPEAPIREEILVTAGNVLELAGSVSVPGAVALIARRIALRLAGRGRVAARLEITAVVADAAREIPIEHPRGLAAPEELARVLAPAIEEVGTELATRAPVGSGAWRLRVVVAGEAIADGALREIAAEGSAPYAAHVAIPLAHDTPAVRHAHPAPELEGTISPLAVVLSTSGSLFALSPLGGRVERREPHRRTRRGKLRRSRPTPGAQPPLFDHTSAPPPAGAAHPGRAGGCDRNSSKG
jgi:hypothetical protein